MRLFFTTALALSQAFVVLSQHAEAAFHPVVASCNGHCQPGTSSCEEYAKKAGLPTDGWEIVHDSDGQPRCRRTDIKEFCPGVEFFDADTKEKKCCQDVSGLTWIDKPAQLGKCCAKGHVWTYENGAGSKRGGCCPVGFHMINGVCTPNTPPPPPSCPTGTHLVDGKCVPTTPQHLPCPAGFHMYNGVCTPDIPIHNQCPIGTHLIDGKCVPSTGPYPHTCGNGNGGVEPSCTCTNSPVCGHGKHLGIKYGHCYILSFGDGEQLGLDRDHTDYKKNGFFVDIPFKVCKSTTDCARGKEVEKGEAFSLQDQHGLYKDLLSTKGWISNASGGAHMEFTTDASHAGKFTGIPSCAGGECALQLHGSPGGGALAYACPMPGPGLTLYGNPKVGQKLRFSEVTCDEYEVPLTSGINLN
ncbi:hypothetical protein DFJ58DRAFT_734507 [Suillus subalutaceus]|uniref:uncharacterized protein n=1 Tax=Suillus subalutaceus TaxID=48586 RepID=UPI001B884561|nr:uncharacterized protein DFJ58DRAFT_734507 [Suillus subalutaceus]KAG1837156.1 hypothetical protein DFJ58DRAFT_734507 [Suillus subalutaceus]